VPVKRLDRAKTRLVGATAAHRRELALAFALDTAAAVLRSPLVTALVVVTDEPDAARALAAAGALVVADAPDAGLNPALRHGVGQVVARHPGCGVGAVSADLPALRTAELERALARVPPRGAAFVRDARGDGTTALLARRPDDFAPAFGAGSAAAHLAAGARDITGPDLASLRHDVDTADDLDRALAMGVGPHTAQLAARLWPSTAR
jgi:2-phospho-L-lactate guanylyltransferase